MDKLRWQRIQGIFDHIVDKTPSHRQDYLDMVCEDDEETRHEVERLLLANDDVTKAAWMPSADTTTLTPDTIGDYAISAVLGEGGMGTVYEATDKSGKQVALKVLPGYLLGDENSQQRFIREAETLGSVSHPSICRIEQYFVTSDGQPSIAMEICPGRTLSSLLQDGPLHLSRSVNIVKHIAEGLSAVHALNIYHRDIKPANILINTVDGQDEIKLIDFGIAKFADTRLTATGIILGSPNYMSPEQWRGEKADQSTDLWSLGVMLFEMLAGENPFGGDTPQLHGINVLGEQPIPLPTLSVDGKSTKELSPIIKKLLEKSPQKRYQDCDSLLHALPLSSDN